MSGKMNRLGMFAVSAAILMLCASANVMGQPPGRGQGGGGQGGRGGQGMNPRLMGNIPAMSLVQLEEVSKELKVSDEQKERLEEVQKNMQSRMQELREENQGDREAMMEAMQTANAEMAEQTTKVFDEGQQKRLMQIYLQVNGAMALTDKKVAEMLKLTEDQSAELTEAIQENRSSMREEMQGLRDLEAEERETKIAEFIKSRDESLMSVLTDEQKEAMEKAMGEKLAVDLSKMQRGGRGQRGQGGAGGRGAGRQRAGGGNRNRRNNNEGGGEGDGGR